MQCKVYWKFSFCETSPSGAQITRFIVMVLIHAIPPANGIIHSKALKSLNDIPRWEIMPPIQWGIHGTLCSGTKAVAENIWLCSELKHSTILFRAWTQYGSIAEMRLKGRAGKIRSFCRVFFVCVAFCFFCSFVWFQFRLNH